MATTDEPTNHNRRFAGIKYAPEQCMVTLEFPEPLEAQYMQHHQAIFAAQDLSAAWLYLAMVAPGLITMIYAATSRPDLWCPAMEDCIPLTATTTPVILTHLLLLYLLRPFHYRALRGPLIIMFRILYTLSSVWNGLQQCTSVAAWWNEDPESPSSAFLWRAGAIALVWHATAFRLPFRQHIYVQSVMAILFVLLLADAVCLSLFSVLHGPHIVGFAQQLAKAFWAIVDVVAYFVDVTPGLLRGSASNPAAGALLSACPAHSSCSSHANEVCLVVVRTWQVFVGLGVMTAALYWLEARHRYHWWRQRQEQHD